jgi:hypothetical protein
MSRHRFHWQLPLAFAFAVGCGSRATEDGSAGSPGGASSGGGGGKSATTNAAGTSGSMSDGAAGDEVPMAGTGGTAGDAVGQSAGANGDVRSGGAGGNGGAPQGTTESWTFDSGPEAWEVRSTNPTTLQDVVVLVWSGDDGNPRPGMLQLVAPFDSAGQSAQIGLRPASPLDLTGKTLSANVKVAYGLGADLAANPGGARIYVRSGNASTRATSAFRNLDAAGQWFSLSLDASAPSVVDTSAGSYDVTDVREIGIEIASNSTAGSTTGVIVIDTVAF